jgi:hypothetical protein
MLKRETDRCKAFKGRMKYAFAGYRKGFSVGGAKHPSKGDVPKKSVESGAEARLS